jgi:hypothetical protein
VQPSPQQRQVISVIAEHGSPLRIPHIDRHPDLDMQRLFVGNREPAASFGDDEGSPFRGVLQPLLVDVQAADNLGQQWMRGGCAVALAIFSH